MNPKPAQPQPAKQAAASCPVTPDLAHLPTSDSGPARTATTRPLGIGGSDIGAVLGLSPYRSAVDVWADLVGRVPRETQDAVHLRFGQHAESFVAAEYERATGRAVVECPQTLFHHEHGFMFAHVDRLVLERAGDTALQDGWVTAPGVLECKTANAFSAHGWGQPGSDRVPAAYLAQCAWYTAVTGCAWADLAVLIGNSDFRVYRLARDPELEALVLGRAKAFWYENVLAQRPPRGAHSIGRGHPLPPIGTGEPGRGHGRGPGGAAGLPCQADPAASSHRGVRVAEGTGAGAHGRGRGAVPRRAHAGDLALRQGQPAAGHPVARGRAA